MSDTVSLRFRFPWSVRWTIMRLNNQGMRKNDGKLSPYSFRRVFKTRWEAERFVAGKVERENSVEVRLFHNGLLVGKAL